MTHDPRARTYEELQSEEHRLRRLIEHGQDALFTLDAELIIRFCSDSTLAILAREAADVIGCSALDLVDPSDVEHAAGVLQRMLRAPGARIEDRVRIRRPDGTTRELRGSGTNLLDDPSVRAIVIALRDVTEAQAREQALEQSERRFRMLADRARDIVARYSLLPEPKCEYISPAVERATGYSTQEYYDDPYLHAKIIHPEDRDRLTLLTQRTPEELSVPITLRWVRKDGETVWIEQSLVPELDADGRVVAIESISRDVTEQVRLETDLRRAQKLDAVGRLAGGIAHDFNNLLGVTLLCAEQLKRLLANEPSHKQWVEMILDSARRGSELSQQLLTFARREVTRDKPSDVHLVLRALRPMLDRVLPEDVRLQLELNAHDSVIGLGQTQLEQVVMNLVVNARDAMPRGGVVTLRTDNRAAVNHAAVRSTPSARQPRGFVLQISDDGVGMSAEVLDRVFEPFFTTKAPNDGSGLGLSVVYGIVTQSGGHIGVRSTPGLGTTFTLQWPCAELSAQPPHALREGDSLPRGTETVLLVEDAQLLLRLAADMLGRLGYHVLGATTADEAVRLFEDAAKSKRPVDLLLTDVVLPGESGVALAKRLCTRQPQLRVLYTSGHAPEEMVRHGLPKGQTAFVAKPFSEGELAHAVRAAIDAPA